MGAFLFPLAIVRASNSMAGLSIDVILDDSVPGVMMLLIGFFRSRHSLSVFASLCGPNGLVKNSIPGPLASDWGWPYRDVLVQMTMIEHNGDSGNKSDRCFSSTTIKSGVLDGDHDVRTLRPYHVATYCFMTFAVSAVETSAGLRDVMSKP